MVFLRKLVAGFLFLVVAVPTAWIAMLADTQSPMLLLVVSVAAGTTAAVLWRDKAPPTNPAQSSTISSVPNMPAVEPGEAYVPAGYAELGLEERLSAYFPDDRLGRAAEIGRATRQAEKDGKHDLTWRLVHLQKMEYMQHAAKSGFTRSQTLALDGSLHKVMANVLRKEGKHKDALVHILYWASSYDKISAGPRKIVQAYVNRAKLPGVRDTDVFGFLQSGLQRREYTDFQSQVALWSETG